jgi:hypothetical protein
VAMASKPAQRIALNRAAVTGVAIVRGSNIPAGQRCIFKHRPQIASEPLNLEKPSESVYSVPLTRPTKPRDDAVWNRGCDLRRRSSLPLQ